MRLVYRKTEPIIINRVVCCECGKKTRPFSFVWRLTKFEGLFITKKTHEYLCKTCAPMKYQFTSYFYNKAMLDATIADKIVRDEIKSTTKSGKKKLRMIQEDKRKPRGNKCPCGSGRKTKNCFKKGKCNG